MSWKSFVTRRRWSWNIILKQDIDIFNQIKYHIVKRIAEIKAKIKDAGDLVAFMYDHCVACAEEYTDWTARRAVKEIAKEMLGLDLD